MMKSFYGLVTSELDSYLQGLGHSKFVTSQTLAWVYKHQQSDMALWSNVSKKLRENLQTNFQFDLPIIDKVQRSIDGTTKFLLRLHDGETIESVLIPSGGDRLTQCLSTQVGCAMKCSFCYSGTQGLTRNLSSSEIVGQYLVGSRWLANHPMESYPRITNLVYMGQGEPLHNYDEVLRATTVLIEPQGVAFGQRKVTLSTCGLIPQILKMNDFPPINLAVSLHSPRDSVRDVLMPINRTYNLSMLFAALNQLHLKAYRRITYEYLLIDGLTNTPEDLDLLCKLLIRERSKLNLIPFNHYPGHTFRRPSDEKNLWFCNEMGERGFTCTIRQSKGTDILAACGQLQGVGAPFSRIGIAQGSLKIYQQE